LSSSIGIDTNIYVSTLDNIKSGINDEKDEEESKKGKAIIFTH
jgi:hypothetical protein